MLTIEFDRTREIRSWKSVDNFSSYRSRIPGTQGNGNSGRNAGLPILVTNARKIEKPRTSGSVADRTDKPLRIQKIDQIISPIFA